MTSDPATFGFNVIGYTSNSGIGVATERTCELLAALAIPFSRFDLERRSAPPGSGEVVASYPSIGIADLPFAINLLVIPINIVDLVFARFEPEALQTTRLNAAICFWELSSLPPRWIASLDRLDVIVAMSDYMRQIYALATSGPWVVPGRLPCSIPDAISADRTRFGIPDDRVVFVTSFEPASDIRRKNPMGVVDAFLLGLHDDDDAYLVLRIKNCRSTGEEHPIVGSLRARLNGHPRVLLILEELDYREVLALYKSCDVFVSLHRAEGLGLGMLEAMGLGMPVLATGWSGNMTFMDHRSACLVRYGLVPVEAEIPAYANDHLEDTTVWAEPDLQHAARWMKRLTRDRAFRLDMGDRARTRYASAMREAEAGVFVEELRRIHDARCNGESPKVRLVDGSGSAVRTGRLARIQALERELAWIKSRPAYRVVQSLRRIVRPEKAS